MKKEAKYQELSRMFIEKIESGLLLPGERIPSENELMATHRISNTTARKVLLDLEIKGYANRIKGKGTYVLNRSEDKHLTRVLGSFTAMKGNFSDNLIKEGFTPKNVIIEKTIYESGLSVNINGRNFIMEGRYVKIRRLRYADELLLKDETRYLSLDLCPRINVVDLNNRSLIGLYENVYKLKIGEGHQTLGVSIIYPEDMDTYFENSSPIPIYIIDRVILCDNGKPVEIEHSYYRGDKYKFTVNSRPELITALHDNE